MKKRRGLSSEDHSRHPSVLRPLSLNSDFDDNLPFKKDSVISSGRSTGGATGYSFNYNKENQPPSLRLAKVDDDDFYAITHMTSAEDKTGDSKSGVLSSKEWSNHTSVARSSYSSSSSSSSAALRGARNPFADLNLSSEDSSWITTIHKDDATEAIQQPSGLYREKQPFYDNADISMDQRKLRVIRADDRDSTYHHTRLFHIKEKKKPVSHNDQPFYSGWQSLNDDNIAESAIDDYHHQCEDDEKISVELSSMLDRCVLGDLSREDRTKMKRDHLDLFAEISKENDKYYYYDFYYDEQRGSLMTEKRDQRKSDESGGISDRGSRIDSDHRCSESTEECDVITSLSSKMKNKQSETRDWWSHSTDVSLHNRNDDFLISLGPGQSRFSDDSDRD